MYSSPARALRARRRTRAAYLGGGLAAILLAVAAGVALAPHKERPSTLFVPVAPIPLTPATSTEAETPGPTDAPARPDTHSPLRPTSRPVTDPVSSAGPVASASAPSSPLPSVPAPAPVPVLVVGATIGLSPAGSPGERVRHDDSAVTIGTLAPRDRADSRFVVRAGAADARCFTFEADNDRGHFLRHRDYQLHLDAADGTPLFAADSTFCPVAGAGGIVTLRSHNYPTLFVTRRQSLLLITTVATGFQVRSPQ